MENSETLEKLKHLETEIKLIEQDVSRAESQLSYLNDRLTQLKHRKQSIINYLNEEHE